MMDVPLACEHERPNTWIATDGCCEDDNDDLVLQCLDFENVILGIEEDWSCAEAMQRGIASSGDRDDTNTLTNFTYGRFEGGNVTFLQNVGFAAEELAQETWAAYYFCGNTFKHTLALRRE